MIPQRLEVKLMKLGSFAAQAHSVNISDTAAAAVMEAVNDMFSVCVMT